MDDIYVFDSSVNGPRSAVQARNLRGSSGRIPLPLNIFSPPLDKYVGSGLELLDLEKIWALLRKLFVPGYGPGAVAPPQRSKPGDASDERLEKRVKF